MAEERFAVYLKKTGDRFQYTAPKPGAVCNIRSARLQTPISFWKKRPKPMVAGRGIPKSL
jgi:hypothetical protein